ncbi:A-kinase anchor protein 8-like [Silurus asotus]|uniref:A-kinase anchor protein 8-like n=1 Tax=Silurus asotus TaxID=30991 RepID=A0AAD5FQ11_SILAS|nr:A-kinase anchor protein 8-like [Silurus asotus]
MVGIGNRDCRWPGRPDSGSHHLSPGGIGTDVILTKIKQHMSMQQEEEKKRMDRSRDSKPLDPHFAYPLPKNFYGSDDFANDELPQHGCIDFGCGGEAQRPRSSSGEDHGAQPVFSTRKAKRKLWKKRSKALKAAYKAQAALGFHTTGGTDDITTEKIRRTRRNNPRELQLELVAFVCSVCKFHSFYRKKLAEHLESTFHKEHFKFLLEHLSEPTVNFLQMMMVESKQMGLSTAQRILSERFMKKKLKLYLKDAMVTNKPEVNQEVPNAVPDMMSQDAFCDQVSKASEAVRNRKDQVEPFCERVINAEEKPGERKDQQVEPFYGRLINAEEEQKDQQVEPFCERLINAEEEPGERKDQQVDPFSEQLINTEEELGERKDQVEEPFCKWVINAEEESGERKDQVVEPFCERVINAEEELGERKDQKVEHFCEQEIEAEKTVREPENQEVAPSSEGMITATEAVMNRSEQQAVPMWEESNPAGVPKRNEDVQEKPERQDLAKLLFSLLDEEEDMEGVELGEEEQEENEYL